ncbi:CUB and peptidase domain-containing protein 1-like [Oculina patagonica]
MNTLTLVFACLCATVALVEGNCGRRPHTRIVGGTEAPVNSWPWQAMIMYAGKHPQQFCGGSLVHPNWVLTAAHCVNGKKPSSILVRMGAHGKYIKVGTEQDIKVEEIIVHPNYKKPKSESNDIALLKLDKPAKLGKGVGLVCMPDPGLPLPVDDPNRKCWITGWGKLAFQGASAKNLMQVDVPLHSNARCKAKFYRSSQIDESMLCAGLEEGGVDSCQGDSGGPLVCEYNGKWYLEGATSWGVGCADPRISRSICKSSSFAFMGA